MKPVHTLVDDVNEQLKERVSKGLTTKEAIESMHPQLDFDMEEYVKFQELKSLAVSDGTLTLEDGMYIYGILGEAGPEDFNGSHIAIKVVFTELFTRWMRDRITSMSS